MARKKVDSKCAAVLQQLQERRRARVRAQMKIAIHTNKFATQRRPALGSFPCVDCTSICVCVCNCLIVSSACVCVCAFGSTWCDSFAFITIFGGCSACVGVSSSFWGLLCLLCFCNCTNGGDALTLIGIGFFVCKTWWQLWPNVEEKVLYPFLSVWSATLKCTATDNGNRQT